jgi:hypothetical protein
MHPIAHSDLAPDGRGGEGSMPWNAKSDARKLGPCIPTFDVWASAKEGIDQVGLRLAHEASLCAGLCHAGGGN